MYSIFGLRVPDYSSEVKEKDKNERFLNSQCIIGFIVIISRLFHRGASDRL